MVSFPAAVPVGLESPLGRRLNASPAVTVDDSREAFRREAPYRDDSREACDGVREQVTRRAVFSRGAGGQARVARPVGVASYALEGSWFTLDLRASSRSRPAHALASRHK
jgi:hypothetical protein